MGRTSYVCTLEAPSAILVGQQNDYAGGRCAPAIVVAITPINPLRSVESIIEGRPV